MITISDGIFTIPEGERFVGFCGDNLHTQKKFFIRTNPESGWIFRLYLTFDDGRHNFFTLPYEAKADGVELIWEVKEDHILKSGLIKAQIKAFSDDNEVYHTTCDVFVAGKATEEDEEFFNSNSEFIQYEKNLNELYRKMNSASAKMPCVGTNGNWFTYNADSESYEDSGVSASAVGGIEAGSITPEKLDREYWKRTVSKACITEYEDLFANVDFVNAGDGSFALMDVNIRTGSDGTIKGSCLVYGKSHTAEGGNAEDDDIVYLINNSTGEFWKVIRHPIWSQQGTLSGYGFNPYRLTLNDVEASKVNISDNDNYFESENVEGAFREVGEDLEDIKSRLDGRLVVSWKEVQDIVRAGEASKFFSIGDKFVCEHEKYGFLEWMVIGIDHDTSEDENLTHSMTLKLETPVAAPQYDAPEALFTVTTELMVGTPYCFKLQDDWVYFVPDVTIPVGACIVFPYYNFSDDITQTPVYIYRTPDDAEPMVTYSIQAGSPGVGISNFVKQNNIYRAQYGSNNWAQSAMRQFLNSGAEAGKVWSAQNEFDRPPTWANDTAGFLNGMDEDFLAVIGNVLKPTNLSPADSRSTEPTIQEIRSEKFFLMSTAEVYGGDYYSGNVAEGSPYKFYSQNSSRDGESISNDTNRIEYRNGSTVYSMLRTPFNNETSVTDEENYHHCYINTKGGIKGKAVNDVVSFQVAAPCCCIV